MHTYNQSFWQKEAEVHAFDAYGRALDEGKVHFSYSDGPFSL